MNQDTQKSTIKKKEYQSKSPIWNHFKRVLVNGVCRAQCLENGCGTTLSMPNWSTSSLHKHLRDIHCIDNIRKKSNGRTIVGRVTHKLSKLKKKKLDHLAVQAIIKDGRCFNDLQKSGLKQFLQYAIPGYVPIHRNLIQKKLRDLYNYHHKLMVENLAKVSDIAITVDFWSDMKVKSYMVLTGHYVDEEFKSYATILQFSSFDKRHFSHLIGQEIEKQLVDLKIFHKVTTITCDNAPNMLGLFDFLSRDIKQIPCVAHVFHLIICNGLYIWQDPKKDDDNNRDESITGTHETSFDEGLSQSVRKMSIGDVAENSIDQSDGQNGEDASGSETSEGEMATDGEDESGMETADWSDNNDDEVHRIEDNFQVGLITNEDNTRENSPIAVEKQIVLF